MNRRSSACLRYVGILLASLTLGANGARIADARPADPSEEPSRTARQTRSDAGVTFKDVLNPFDYFSNSWSVVGLKDYPDGTRISPNGELLLGNETVCELLAGEGLRPLDKSIRMSLVKGYLPIIHYDFLVNDSVEYIIEVFACPMPAAGKAGYDFATNRTISISSA